MSTINITKARSKLYEITDQVITSHEHLTLTCKHGNVVLLAEDDFDALMETVSLQSVPSLSMEARSLNDDDMDLLSRNELEW